MPGPRKYRDPVFTGMRIICSFSRKEKGQNAAGTFNRLVMEAPSLRKKAELIILLLYFSVNYGYQNANKESRT